MAKVIGQKIAVQRLSRLVGPEMIARVGGALFVGGEMIQTEAQISLTTGAVSGKNHVPSAPGTPPNNDSGVLANNIETAQVAPLKVQVSSNAPYAAIHEFGGTINHPGGTPYFIVEETGLAKFVHKGSPQAAGLPVTKPHVITMPERPYMRPAMAKRRKEVTALVQKAVNAALKGA